MIKLVLIEIYERELQKVIEELNQYKHEKTLWESADGINNSAGNLALHLIGNLKYFIGAVMGGTGYVRFRELEFTRNNIPRQEIITELKNLIEEIKETLGKYVDKDFAMIYPIKVLGDKEMTTAFFLTHLAIHLSYHLGQINYHRRLLS